MTGALNGIRVIDFGQYLAGPLASMLLADAGADVIRVDSPGGPRWQHPANSVLQRGKRSIVLDLKEVSDHSVAERLIASADVVVENFRPGVMQRLGLGPSDSCKANPQLIYCSIPGFASDDPRSQMAAYEGIVAAAAGLYLSGTWDASDAPAPVFNPIPLASNFGAIRAAEAIVAALFVRERDGIGQEIEVPLFDATFELKFTPHKRGNTRSRQPRRVEFDLVLDAMFECADGRFVNLSWLEGRQLRAFADMVGLTPELDRDGLLDESKLWANGLPSEELRRRLAAVFRTRSAAEWAQTANPAADLSNCLTTQEWLRTEPHARESRAVVSVVDPELGSTLQAGAAFSMSRTPPCVDSPRRPLDMDRDAILSNLEPRPASRASQASDVRLPLDGIRVIDTTQILAGPTCGRILAEFGAEVIKINAPVGHPIMGHPWLNSGKRSLLLDLKTSDGREVLHCLLATADVFLMNFAPQSAERLGVSEAEVRQYHSDIIYTCVSCYGWEGSRGTYRGHEQMGQAVSGMQERWGRDLGMPVMQSMPICDLGTGNLAAFATLLALFHRMRTGEGQFVSASLAQTATFHQIPFMLDYVGRSWEDDPAGQQQRGLGRHYGLYPAKDGWFFLAACDADQQSRLQELQTQFGELSAVDCVRLVTAAGLAGHVVVAPHEVMERSYALLEEHDVPGMGPAVVAGPSGRLSATPLRRTPPPRVPGGDNADILGELGMADRYDALLASGVVADSVRSTLARP
ncbi:MAG: CoA transferase [Chloroflexi bacterium]|nr:CoA transferase [Chloroflexota bacterium]